MNAVLEFFDGFMPEITWPELIAVLTAGLSGGTLLALLILRTPRLIRVARASFWIRQRR